MECTDVGCAIQDIAVCSRMQLNALCGIPFTYLLDVLHKSSLTLCAAPFFITLDSALVRRLMCNCLVSPKTSCG